ncbi:MAG: helix-turn-helix domain-containing protein [Pyrinomonadaceae bacterium]
MIRKRMEELVTEMLDGKILLTEAVEEFEKLYIQNALKRNGQHLSNTAEALGIHRNTLSKRMAHYNGNGHQRAAAKVSRSKNGNRSKSRSK